MQRMLRSRLLLHRQYFFPTLMCSAVSLIDLLQPLAAVKATVVHLVHCFVVWFKVAVDICYLK